MINQAKSENFFSVARSYLPYSNVDTHQEGASKEDIEQLSKFKFIRSGTSEKLSGEAQVSVGGTMTECGTDSPAEHRISQEDAVS